MKKESKQKYLRSTFDYTVKNPAKKQSMTLTRREWCEILLRLGPEDGNDRLYEKIDRKIKIFDK